MLKSWLDLDFLFEVIGSVCNAVVCVFNGRPVFSLASVNSRSQLSCLAPQCVATVLHFRQKWTDYFGTQSQTVG